MGPRSHWTCQTRLVRHIGVNIRRLKFFEERDEAFGDSNVPPRPMVGVDGVEKFEIRRISNSRTHKGRRELWVEWTGYDQSHNCWVLRDVLVADVPAMLTAYEANPSSLKARASAPKRGTQGSLPPPPVVLRRAGLRQR